MAGRLLSSDTSGFGTGCGFSPAVHAPNPGATADQSVARAKLRLSWFSRNWNPGFWANRRLAGYLRDAYPLNVVSEPHLSQRVDGLPLAD